jgi:two-component system, sensor histidine kinase and response regulator
MKRILVIDDAPEILELVAEAVSENGWKALPASSGEEGLALARAQDPDLVLCDIQLPGINGYEVLKQIRAHPATATKPFVFLSGVVDRAYVRQGMELGADDYIEKPFTVAELIRALEARFQKEAELLRKAEQRFNELRTNLTLALPHELVTPLNSIIGFSSLLVDGNMPKGEALECARHIRDAADRLQRLIENFLFYAQLELISTDPARVTAFQSDHCDQAAESISITSGKIATERGRTQDLRIETAEGLVAPISCSNLDRLLRELVDNAFKFSDRGTSVSVSVRSSTAQFEVLVTDQGRGMTPEQIRDIAPHMQFERKMYEQQGTGLGLAIARKIAELYGGDLRIQSIPQKFTKVHVILPTRAA